MEVSEGRVNDGLIGCGTHASAGGGWNGLEGTPPWERAEEPMVPVPSYAFTAQRYMHEFGVPKEHFGHVAISARKWAQLNPDATMREEWTMEEYLASPSGADPLTVLECWPTADAVS